MARLNFPRLGGAQHGLCADPLHHGLIVADPVSFAGLVMKNQIDSLGLGQRHV